MTRTEAIRLALNILKPFGEAGSIYDDYKIDIGLIMPDYTDFETTSWAAVFLLVGATFLSAGWVQQWRGHVGIQALGAVLPPAADRIRRFVSDIVTLVFCLFFGWKCWSLLILAIKDGQISGSAFGAPLWIPYGCMAAGMTLVVLVLAVQVLTRQALQQAAAQ